MTVASRSLPLSAPQSTAFAFLGDGVSLTADGPEEALPRGPVADLPQRVAQIAGTLEPSEVIAGALPFDGTEDDCLWRAKRRANALAEVTPLHTPVVQMTPEPAPQAYGAAVARALEIMKDTGPDALRKVVLARSLNVTAARPIDTAALMHRFALDPAALAYQVQLPALPGDTAPRHLMGATPELLLRKTGAQVLSHPLAGSARRSPDPGQDAEAAAGLDGSDKDHREHAMVVEYILDTLSPLCRTLACPEGTRLTSTRSMWHLGTRIEGTLKDADTPSILLAAALHPTPAVCGLPVAHARDTIKALEPRQRGFYAGAVGWNDAQGDGAWYVAIRCAEICGASARLFAGAGIVPGSDPASETAETGAKFAATLTALGLSDDAGLAVADTD